MKIKYVIVFLLMVSFGAFAYSENDTVKVKAKKNNKDKALVKEADSSFKKQKRKKDVFIDKDGDGICDNRANGMSFEKFRKRHRMQGKNKQGSQGGKQ